MPNDISLLPEELRQKEQSLKQSKAPVPEDPSELKFSIPEEETEEIEIIEIDEGEVDQVLAGEPAFARLMYKVTSLVEEAKLRFFSPQKEEPAPKVPPHFFSAPGQGSTTQKPTLPGGSVSPASPDQKLPSSTSGAPSKSSMSVPGAVGGASSKARLMPLPNAPRRVRVIKRVRKPVRVSFVSEEEVHLLRVDVPRRRFTLVLLSLLCLSLLGGSYELLRQQRESAARSNADAKAQLADVRQKIKERQTAWANYQDLEPRLKTLAKLLDAHVSPTSLLQQIEDRTLPSVYYGSFSFTPDNRIQLSVVADSLQSAARQIVSFQKSSFVKKVDASSYSVIYDPPQSQVQKSVQFQLVLTLNESALKPSAVTVTVTP